MTNLENHWAGFVMSLARQKPAAYIQIRKIFRGMGWSIPFEDFDGLSLKPEHLGYSAGPSKLNQLKRNYLNVAELERARDSLLERMSKQQSSITARFGNQEKDSRSQGYCLQTITLSYISKPEPLHPKFVVEVYYRSTEIGQKFFADLMFLQEVVFPILLRGLPQPDRVNFVFSTVYLSSMFLPILFQLKPVDEVLQDVKDCDPKWFTRCVRTAVAKWMEPECGYNYRTRAKMHTLFRDHVYPYMDDDEIKNTRRLLK